MPPKIDLARAGAVIDLERHVASAAGVSKFHEPIGTVIAPHPHMPKYAQKAKPIMHNGKQIGFVAARGSDGTNFWGLARGSVPRRGGQQWLMVWPRAL